jgi:hypothetical protein
MMNCFIREHSLVVKNDKSCEKEYLSLPMLELSKKTVAKAIKGE